MSSWDDFETVEQLQPPQQSFSWNDLEDYNPETKGWKGIAQDAWRDTKQFGEDISNIFTNPELRSRLYNEFKEGGKGAFNQLQDNLKIEFNPFHNPYGGEDLYTPENPDKNRFFKNSGAGALKAARALYNVPSNMGDYLAKKGIIPEEFEGTFGHIPEDFDYGQALGVKGQKAGDKFIQNVVEMLPYIAGGEAGLAKNAAGLLRKTAQRTGAQALHELGRGESVVPALIGTPALEYGGRALLQAGKIAASPVKTAQQAWSHVPDLTPSGIIAKHAANKISPEKLATNIRAAEGTNTPLGRIVESPLLKTTQEKITNQIPFGQGSKILSDTANQITKKGETLLGDIGGGKIIGDPNEIVGNIVKDVKIAATKEKNALFTPVNELAEKEGIYADLPKTIKYIRENIKMIEDTPMYKANPDFRKQINKMAGLTNTTEKIKSSIVNEHGQPLTSKTNKTSIKDARIIASDLYDKGEKLTKSVSSIDREYGFRYKDIAKKIRNEIDESIQKRGSDALKSANEKAMKNYKENYVQFLDKDVNNLLKNGEISETFIRDVIRPGKLSDKADRIIKIQNLLKPDQRGLMGQAYLSDAIDTTGTFNPMKLKQKINSLGERQLEALFGNKKQDLLDYVRLIDMNPNSIKKILGTYKGDWKTQLYSIALTGAPMSIIGSPASSIAQGGIARWFNKKMTDPIFRNLVIEKMNKILPNK